MVDGDASPARGVLSRPVLPRNGVPVWARTPDASPVHAVRVGRSSLFVEHAMTDALHARLLASSRPNPEDRAEVFERLVVVVADGAGGLRGGAAASEALVVAARAAGQDGSFDGHAPPRWGRLFANGDASLSVKMTGETTGVVVVLSAAGIVGVSAGDSEAWIARPTTIDDLTREQSKVRLGSGRASPVVFGRARLR